MYRDFAFSDGLFAFRRIKQHENGGGEHHQDGGQHHRAVMVFRAGGAEILINQGGEREPFGARQKQRGGKFADAGGGGQRQAAPQGRQQQRGGNVAGRLKTDGRAGGRNEDKK